MKASQIKHRFYFGETVLKKRLNQEVLTFPQLVKRFQKPDEIGIRAKKFHQLNKRDKLRQKDGTYICPCSFIRPYRTDVNSDTIQLICLDIDNPEEAHRLDELTLDSYLSEFNYLAYPTISSTRNEPRLRIMVEANGKLDTSLYISAVSTIAHILDLDEISTESLIISQPMFTPKKCKDAPFWLIYNTSGRPFDEKDIKHEAIKHSRMGKNKASNDEDGFINLVSPLDVDLETIESALYKLDPDMGRLEWIKVACALKHQFQGAEEGYTLFDLWSAKGEKYEGPEDTRRQWDYEQANPTDREPVTIKTIFKLARENGWKDPHESDAVEQFISKILAATTPEELQKLPRELSKTPMDRINRDILVNMIHKQLKKAGSFVSIAVIRQECKFTGDPEKIYQAENGTWVDNRFSMPAWAEGLYYVQHTNEFYNKFTGARLSPEVADNTFGRLLLTKEDRMEGKAKPDERPRDLLLNIYNIPSVYGYVYLPNEGGELMIEGLTYVNLYQPFKLKKDREYSEDAKKLFMGHFKWILPNPGEARILVDFLAYVVQNPGKRVNWAILLQSVDGAGKTILAKLMASVLGKRNVDVADNVTLTSNYTSWAEGKQLLFVEEIRISGHNRFELMDKMKPYITNDEVTIRHIYTKAYSIPNATSYIMFSNHHDALAITNNDRRYCILMSAIQDKKQIMMKMKETDGEYFTRMYQFIDKHPGAILHWLDNHRISESFDPKSHAPVTVHRQKMIDLAKSDMELAIEEVLGWNVTGCNRDLLSDKVLVDLLRMLTMEDGRGLPMSRRHMSQTLAKMGYSKCDIPVMKKADNHTIWLHITARQEVKDNPEHIWSLRFDADQEFREEEHDEIEDNS